MAQPQYDEAEVRRWSNLQLAAHLEQWARARDYVAERRRAEGKMPTDSTLLRVAAERLRTLAHDSEFWSGR